MFKLTKYLSIAVLIIVIFSCINDNFDTTVDDYEQTSSISIPIKDLEVGAEDYGDIDDFLNYYNDHQSVIVSNYIDFNYSYIVNDSADLKSLLYRFYIVNEFPSSLQVEIYLLDDINQTITVPSVTEENPITINSPVLDEDGNIISSSEHIIDLEFDEDNINAYFNVNRLLLRINFLDLNTNQTILDKLEEYKVSISVGVRAKISISANS